MRPPRRDPFGDTAKTVFVDRDEPKRIFENAIFSIPDDGCILRAWYGVGGQGKTALARELFRISSVEVEPSCAHLRRAMLDLHGRPKGDPDRLLVWIRNAFAEAGVSFPAFDVAFAIMWQKTRGEEALPNFTNPWLYRTSGVVEEASADSVTLSRELLESFAETIPGLGLLIKRGTRWAFDKGKRAWLERSREHLKALYRGGQLIDDYELSSLMPWMLAQDMNQHLSVNPDERFVLFVDEYESIVDGGGMGVRWEENKFDEHLRGFIAEVNGLLALFFSREKIPWERSSDWCGSLAGNQYLLGGLSVKDANEWLTEIPVNDDRIRNSMIVGARETQDKNAAIYPLMLDLQLEHWKNLGDDAVPEDFMVTAESFQGRLETLVRRLLRDYPDSVEQVLSFLALPSRFDEETFRYVIEINNIPLPFNDFERLKDLTIVTEAGDGWLSVHRAVADTIVQLFDGAILENARMTLRQHFEERAKPKKIVDVCDDTQSAFMEASRLRLKEGIDGYVAWLGSVGETLRIAARSGILERIWRQALEQCMNGYGESHTDTAVSFNNLASCLYAQGRVLEAEPLFRKALEISKNVLGLDHPATATSYNNVAFNLDAQGRALVAESLHRKALEIREHVLGVDHPDTAASYNNLAGNLNTQGRALDAEPLYRKALKISENVLGLDHPSTATSYNNVATNLDAQGRALDAEPLYRKALEIRERVLGFEHPDTATSYNNFASNLDAQGRALDAELLYRKALEIRERVLGLDHPSTAASYNNVAANLDAQGRALEAEPLHRKALEIRERLLGFDHPDTATSYNNVAFNLNAQGRALDAEPLYRKALGIRERVLGFDHPSTAASYNNVAYNLNAQGRALDAEPLYRKALGIRERVLGFEHPDTATSYNNVASNLNAQGRPLEAEPLYRKALEISENALGTDHPQTNAIRSNLQALSQP